MNAVRYLKGQSTIVLPHETAIGSLCRYISTPQKHFAPMNINFGLLPPMEFPKRSSKAEKQRMMSERALKAMAAHFDQAHFCKS
jgi:methylenetetrahydrofolate--tRNA-(uracil-5-)-methyltransferase